FFALGCEIECSILTHHDRAGHFIFDNHRLKVDVERIATEVHRICERDFIAFNFNILKWSRLWCPVTLNRSRISVSSLCQHNCSASALRRIDGVCPCTGSLIYCSIIRCIGLRLICARSRSVVLLSRRGHSLTTTTATVGTLAFATHLHAAFAAATSAVIFQVVVADGASAAAWSLLLHRHLPDPVTERDSETQVVACI